MVIRAGRCRAVSWAKLLGDLEVRGRFRSVTSWYLANSLVRAWWMAAVMARRVREQEISRRRTGCPGVMSPVRRAAARAASRATPRVISVVATQGGEHITDAIRQKVAGQVDQVIWQTVSSPGNIGLVMVQREALAVILPMVDIGLAHAALRPSPTVAYRRAALADAAPWSGLCAASDSD